MTSSLSVPAPVGGWNARDSLDAMAPTDAVVLENLFPGQSSIESRAGCEEFSSGLGGDVETIISYRSGATDELIVGANANLYKINMTNGNETSLSSGYTNDRWQGINFNGLLVLCNGADNPVQYNGTVTANITMSGPTVTDIVGVTSFKGRAYYWLNNDQSFWYAAAGAYSGTLTEFPLDIIAQSGGYIVECCTVTRDGGEGQDDYFVILLSTGEALVYQGDDPGSATDWSLVGRYSLGVPLSVRGSTQLASDRIVITKDGWLPLSGALQQARLNEQNNISGKIIKAAKSAANAYADNYGWEIIHYPKESMLIVNVPVDVDTTAANSTYEQHVMNTNTGSWCKFTGWKAITFAVSGDELYFGDADGKIFKAYTGTEDDGAFIKAKFVPAFHPLSTGATEKVLQFATLMSDYYTPKHVDVIGLSDFNIPPDTTIRTPPDGSQAEWDTSDWDQDFWAGNGTDEPMRAEIYPVEAFGFMISIMVRVMSKIQRHRWVSIKYQFENTGSS